MSRKICSVANRTAKEALETERAIILENLRNLDPDKLIELWWRYEDVAKHFNDLLVRWRIQAMGGMATLVTVAGFVVRDAEGDARYRAMYLLALTLSLAWVALAILDLKYYRLLLRGAVDEIVHVEKVSKTVSLSRGIEAHAEEGARTAPVWFYVLGLAPLLVIQGWALYNLVEPWRDLLPLIVQVLMSIS